MLELILVAGVVLAALGAMLARRLLASALWLAGASAGLALLLYRLGALQLAVTELSVGAGLVTVLFVFAITLAGAEPEQRPTLVPWPLAAGLALAGLGLLLALLWPVPAPAVEAAQPAQPLAISLWGQRGLDAMLQVVLIFSGVLALMGLLAEAPARVPAPATVPATTPAASPAATPKESRA